MADDLDDDFSPEDVFKLFPTAFPMGRKPILIPDTTTVGLNVTGLEPIPKVVYDPSKDTAYVFGAAQDLIILPILLVVIGVIALVGNSFLVCVILGFRRMRTGLNLLLLNIAFSDLVFIAFSIPTAVINHAFPEIEPLNGPVIGADNLDYRSTTPRLEVCKFVHYTIFVTVYVSIYTLVVACVFRFFGDCMGSGARGARGGGGGGNGAHGSGGGGGGGPHTKPGGLLSRGNAVISSFVIWAAFLVSHLNFLVQPDGAVFQQPFICVHSLDLGPAGGVESFKIRTLWVTFLACAFLLPLVTICTLSAILLHRLTRTKPADDAYESAQNAINEKRNKREITVLIMAAMVSRAVCWLPIQVFVMCDIFGVTDMSDVYRKAEMLGVCCSFASSCVNPLLFNCMARDYRRAYNDGFKKLGCNCAPDTTQPDDYSDMNETIMSIISDSSNHINYN